MELDVEDENPIIKSVSGISFSNGQTVDSTYIKSKTEKDLSQVFTDNLDNSNLRGDVYVRVDHPNISQQSYRQSFEINQSNIIDDFEDGDISEYSGDTSVFSVSSSDPYEGTYHSVADSSSNNTHEMVNRTDLTIQQGDTIELYGRTGGGNDRWGFCFGAQSASGAGNYSGYNVSMANGGEQARINRWDNGSENLLAENIYSNTIGSWHKWKVNWATDGKITFVQFDGSGNTNGSISAIDTTYSSGGIGLSSFKQDPSKLDFIRRV